MFPPTAYPFMFVFPLQDVLAVPGQEKVSVLWVVVHSYDRTVRRNVFSCAPSVVPKNAIIAKLTPLITPPSLAKEQELMDYGCNVPTGPWAATFTPAKGP